MHTLTNTRHDAATATLDVLPLNIDGTDLATLPPDAITAGAAAWTRIKAASKMLREDWRAVGEALLVGRKLHKSDKLFGRWCRENGFGDIDRRVRADAMWLAENWSTVHAVDSSICHPTHIRAAYIASTQIWARIDAVTAELDDWSGVDMEAFDRWRCAHGFSGLDRCTLHDAMWFAANWQDIETLTQCGVLSADLCDPTAIRAAYNIARAALPKLL